MKSSVICILFSIVICSCSPTFYMPNTQNVPLHTAKGQTNILGSANGDMVDLQLSHALGDNFGVMLNGALVPEQTNVNGNGGKGAFVEFGGGYFKPISTNFLFEVYGMAGFGSMKNINTSQVAEYPNTTGIFESNMSRIAIQPAFGYTSRYFSAAVSSRMGSINYMNPKGSMIWNNIDQIKRFTDKNSYFMIEPALTLRGGLEKVKIQLQIQKSFNVSEKDFPQKTESASLGLILNL